MINKVKYKKAYFKESNEIKYVEEYETILGVNIYYMEDGTSYGESQLIIEDFTNDDYNRYFNKKVEDIFKNNGYFKKLIEMSSEGFNNYIQEKEKKEYYNNLNLFNKIKFKLRQWIGLPPTYT